MSLLWKDEEEWWTVRNARGNYGLVPVKYLDKVRSCLAVLKNYHCIVLVCHMHFWKSTVVFISGIFCSSGSECLR